MGICRRALYEARFRVPGFIPGVTHTKQFSFFSLCVYSPPISLPSFQNRPQICSVRSISIRSTRGHPFPFFVRACLRASRNAAEKEKEKKESSLDLFTFSFFTRIIFFFFLLVGLQNERDPVRVVKLETTTLVRWRT